MARPVLLPFIKKKNKKNKKKNVWPGPAWHGLFHNARLNPCASRHPTWLLCPLSLLLRFTLSLADLWPVQWFAGPLSGPPLPGYSYPSICVGHPSAHPSCALASCIGGSSWPGVVPCGLPAFDLGTFVLVILLLLPRLLGSWSVYG